MSSSLSFRPFLPASPTVSLPPAQRAELDRLDQDRDRIAGQAATHAQAIRHLEVVALRIDYLRTVLETAEIVPNGPGATDTVGFGALVTVLEGDKLVQYRIVGAHEADVSCGQVSWVSPIGRALLGAGIGERVVFSVPAGQRELEVIAIEYRH